MFSSSVLVTRPVAQAEGLVQLIKQQGGNPILFPCIEIIQTEYQQYKTKQAVDNISDMVIFTSRNAVEKTAPYLDDFSSHTQWFAVGKATRDALQKIGVKNVVIPATTFNSEGLLECLEQVASKHITIFTGKNSRPLLADTLKARGATVSVVPTYERVCPNLSIEPVLAVLQSNASVIVTSTSVESLKNLCELLASVKDVLVQLPLVVVSERIRKFAQSEGWHKIYVSNDPSDESIVAACLDSAA